MTKVGMSPRQGGASLDLRVDVWRAVVERESRIYNYVMYLALLHMGTLFIPASPSDSLNEGSGLEVCQTRRLFFEVKQRYRGSRAVGYISKRGK